MLKEMCIKIHVRQLPKQFEMHVSDRDKAHASDHEIIAQLLLSLHPSARYTYARSLSSVMPDTVCSQNMQVYGTSLHQWAGMHGASGMVAS